MSSLTKLEHGYNIPILSELKPLKLKQLKHKAVFDLKIDNDWASYDLAVDMYIKSWLQDERAGCRPTWRNLVVLLGEIGLGEIARRLLNILTQPCVAIVASKFQLGLSMPVHVASYPGSMKKGGPGTH